MRDRVGLNDRQLRFVRLVAAGEHSITECHARAYGGRRDSSNAGKLAKRLAEFIAAERLRLGLPEPGAEEDAPDITDEETKRLVDEQQRLYRLAIEADPPQVGAAQKCLRAIERLTKPKRAGGRPTSKPAATKPEQTERIAPEEFESLVAAFLTEDDLADIEATWGNDAPPWGRVSQTSAEAQ